MNTDYSAAHSMDTAWFAVDGKGQVACFETLENGVVPATWVYMPRMLERQVESRKKADPRYEIDCDLLLESARAAGRKLVMNQKVTDEDRRYWRASPHLATARHAHWSAILGAEPEIHAPSMVMWLEPLCGDEFWYLDRATNTVCPSRLPPKHARRAEFAARYRETHARLFVWAESQGFANEPPPDYPAAHSMDTQWYAVDRGG